MRINNNGIESISKNKAFSDMICNEPLVLVNFFTEWCGPCNMMNSILEDLKVFIGDKGRILKVDVEKNIKVAARYQVMDVPTYILFRHGKVVWKHSGPVAPSEFKEIIALNT